MKNIDDIHALYLQSTTYQENFDRYVVPLRDELDEVTDLTLSKGDEDLISELAYEHEKFGFIEGFRLAISLMNSLDSKSNERL